MLKRPRHVPILCRSLPRAGLFLLPLTLPLTPAAGAQDPAQGAARAVPPSPFSAARVAQLMAEAPKIQEVELAPDGSWVVYTVARGSVATNQYVTDLLLQRLDPATGAPTGAPTVVMRRPRGDAPAFFTPRRCPDGECLTFFAAAGDSGAPAGVGEADLVRYDLATARATRLPVRDTAVHDADRRPRILAVGSDYRWSPRGTYLAFTGPVSAGRLDPRRGTRVSTSWSGPASKGGLFVLEVNTGIVTQVTPDSLHVEGGFDWSPDERALAFAAVVDAEGIPLVRTDLFVVDRAGGAVHALVRQAGEDGRPHWSPDGRWIAFTSHHGRPTYWAGWPAVVPAAGGAVMRFAGDAELKLYMWGSTPVLWRPDGRGFYYASRHHLTMRLIRADLGARRVSPVSADKQPWDDRFSMSADGHWLAFTREAPLSPPELFVQALPGGAPRQLTRLAPDFPLRELVRVDTVSWPSRDRTFQIHALLLTPAAARPEAGRLTGPLPTLVYLEGGPSMVDRGFARDGWNGASRAMAALGYAVLVPNTRGRPGYGEAFELGVRDGDPPGCGRLPYEDMMEGVDLLIRRGIADPARLGVFGHSHGGFLTSYTVTQTDRFRAAVNHEGGGAFWHEQLARAAASPDYALLNRDLCGFSDLFDPAERQRIDGASAGLHPDRVRTPTLLIFAGRDKSTRSSLPLYNGLQRFGVPSELVVYDEGHAFTRPAAVADDFERTAAWLDYWIRDLPYLDAALQQAYDAWRRQRQP